MINFDALSDRIIGLALEVHRELGPGLLESAYEQCLAHELTGAGIRFQRQAGIPVAYKEMQLDCGFRADLLVEERLIVELKSVEKLMPIHQAQTLTYMRLAKVPIGLLMNFNVPVLKQGIKRLVL